MQAPQRILVTWGGIALRGALAGGLNGILLGLGFPQEPVPTSAILVPAGASHGALLALAIAGAVRICLGDDAGPMRKMALLPCAYVTGSLAGWISTAPFLGVPDVFLMLGVLGTMGLLFSGPVAMIVAAAHLGGERAGPLWLRFGAAGAIASALVWSQAVSIWHPDPRWLPTGLLHGAIFGVLYAGGLPFRARPETAPACEAG